MFKNIFRYCKPQNIDLCLRNQHFLGVNVLNLNTGRCFKPNLKSIHTFQIFRRKAALFDDHENNYAYNILLRDSSNKLIPKPPNDVISSLEDFNKILDQNWRNSNITAIVDTFLKVKTFCILNEVTLADARFDKLVDGLMDLCEHIKDEELISLLYCIGEFPLTESYSSHNFHDIWSCLDDICCWKMVDWGIDKSFKVANAWYKLRLGKLCDYIYILLDRCVKKADVLTKDQLVNIFFYLNVCRRRPVDFEYEYALEKMINYMDIDEMAVVALGFFKTKTKIKLPYIHEIMANKVIENSTTVQDISLTAILKILCYSKPIKICPKIQEMTEKLGPEVERLSHLSCTHLGLLGTGIQLYSPNVLQKISQKFLNSISDPKIIRAKDIERMLNVLTMFNYDPMPEQDIFDACLKEILNKERLNEMNKYPRSLICSMNYLSLRNVYSHELLDKVLNNEYMENNFGKGTKSVPRELFSLDCSIDVECPGYTGSRLPLVRKYKTVKWMIEYTPSHDQWKKLTAADKLVLDTIDTVKSLIGDEKLLYIQHILPHYTRSDIILCKNKKTGQFVEPTGFENYILGDVMVPINDGSLDWFAIVILGWNNTVRDSNMPLGHSIMKARQLSTIGYKPVFVFWNEFLKLSAAMRKEYISNKLR